MVDVTWSADSDGVYVAKRHVTLLPPWADCADNAAAAVEEISDDFWTNELWYEWIGDDTDYSYSLEIHSPPSIAGIYDVDLTRAIKSKAYLRPKKKASTPPSAECQLNQKPEK